MIFADDIQVIIDRLGRTAVEDIEWAEGLRPPATAVGFALEIIFVICNSGMKHTVAHGIYERVRAALASSKPVTAVFRHHAKAEAIEAIWRDRERLHAEFLAATDKVAFARTLPWIGEITAYHVAKNFGADVAKPDIHLQRLADREGVTPQELCERLAKTTGYRVATIDTLLWRACASGVLNSRTGHFTEAA
jgi:hypothetical protein